MRDARRHPRRHADGDRTAARCRGFPHRASTRGQRTGRLRAPAPARRDKGTPVLLPGGRCPLFLARNARLAGGPTPFRARRRPGAAARMPVRQPPRGGRPLRGDHTFIVGLDDTRFPGAGLQDPLLLDAERTPSPRTCPPPGRAWPARRISRSWRRGCAAGDPELLLPQPGGRPRHVPGPVLLSA